MSNCCSGSPDNSRAAESASAVLGAGSANRPRINVRGRKVALLWILIALCAMVAWMGRTERYVSADGRIIYEKSHGEVKLTVYGVMLD